MTDLRIERCIRSNKAVVPRFKFQERLFLHLFCGLVYAQIWEDPEIDLEALALTPECHVVAIASGGCNILSYLTGNPARITAVDLSPAHVSLVRLKLVAAGRLTTWEAFYQFLGAADAKANIKAYDELIAPHLDSQSRAYWDGRSLLRRGRRRITMFANNIYRHGVLGRFIGVTHLIARAYGVDFRELLGARTIAEQRRFFETTLAPLFDKPLIRWAVEQRLSLYGLGIPATQHSALAGGGSMAAVLRQRVERLTCDFGLDDNYFAWQAFGRRYSGTTDGSLPPYLQRTQFDAVRTRTDRVEVFNRSITSYLAECPEASHDRYVLLDAQDWMTDRQLNDLWVAITRTARPGARVIFRTAGKSSLLPGRLDKAVLGRWRYQARVSRDLTGRDRSAIYGGFHLYIRKD